MYSTNPFLPAISFPPLSLGVGGVLNVDGLSESSIANRDPGAMGGEVFLEFRMGSMGFPIFRFSRAPC